MGRGPWGSTLTPPPLPIPAGRTFVVIALEREPQGQGAHSGTEMHWAKQRKSIPPPRPEPSGSPVQPGDAAGEASWGTCPRGCVGSGAGGHRQPFM